MKSNLQIISGKFKGRKLAIPPGARPTQNKARIALFNMLSEIIPVTNHQSPITIWDAFAGSGAFGIECLSRGIAKYVIFTDKDKNACEIIRKNLTGFDPAEYTIVNKSAATMNYRLSTIDLIFIDPPYDKPELGIEIIKHAPTGCVIVWETVTSDQLPVISDIEIIKHKKYGRAEFIIMKKIK